MRISDWSSDVCSSDLRRARHLLQQIPSHLGWSTHLAGEHYPIGGCKGLDGNPRIRVMGEEGVDDGIGDPVAHLVGVSFGDRLAREEIAAVTHRSEEHTSELQSLMRISYAVFCLKKKNN